MKRPHLLNCTCILSQNHLAIKSSLILQDVQSKTDQITSADEFINSVPFKNLFLMKKKVFNLKVKIVDQNKNTIFSKSYFTDRFGNSLIFIDKIHLNSDFYNIQIYEIGHEHGYQFYLGSYLPLKFEGKNIVISDFDKTLVDTKYSSTKEIYHSMTKPVSAFPTVTKSLKMLNSYIEKDYQPFILSASPHFYEPTIRNWLYQNEVYNAAIFLKDYRSIFSINDGSLSPKDLKLQGFYKLNHLLDILFMTEIPKKLVLIGDGFESDPMIYLLLKSILEKRIDPWELWNEVRGSDSFQLSTKQNSHFLNKIYTLKDHISKIQYTPEVSIFIRLKNLSTPLKLPIKSLTKMQEQIQCYEA